MNTAAPDIRPPARWHDPLRLMQLDGPSQPARIVLWAVCLLVLILLCWAGFGELDIIATAEGKLAPQTLLKIVQPAEPGVVRDLLVEEGDAVRAGQVLARLDTTVASADKAGVAADLAIQLMQQRRIEAELAERPMQSGAGDDPALFAQVQRQHASRRNAYLDSIQQEQALLQKTEHEHGGAQEVLKKLEQTLPAYQRAADAYAKLEKEGFVGSLAAGDKQREAVEKFKDLQAQRAAVAALEAAIVAQRKKISQVQSGYKTELQRELAEIKARIAQLQPSLDKTRYREGLTELRAPQDGVIKDLATTTVGSVVQPGTILMTLVPKGEALYADVNVRNEDIGFVQVGQSAQIKLAAYPFQKYGMLSGKVVHVSADASEAGQGKALPNASREADGALPQAAIYRARLRLDSQELRDPNGRRRQLAPGMQIVAEINQGRRTVLDYLLSPVRKTVQEAGRER